MQVLQGIEIDKLILITCVMRRAQAGAVLSWNSNSHFVFMGTSLQLTSWKKETNTTKSSISIVLASVAAKTSLRLHKFSLYTVVFVERKQTSFCLYDITAIAYKATTTRIYSYLCRGLRIGFSAGPSMPRKWDKIDLQ